MRFWPHTASGLGAILLWSTTFAFARSLTERVGPLTGAAAVYLIAGGLFLGIRIALRKRPLDALKLPRTYLLGCGFLFVVYTAFVYLAVGLARNRQQLLEVALVNYLWPAATILLSLVLMRQRASLWLLPGTALALAGVFLVMTQSTGLSWDSFQRHFETNPVVYVLALLAAVCWGLYSNLTRLWAGPNSDGAVELFIPAAGIVLLGMRALTSEPARWTVEAAGEATALAVVTFTSYALWDLAMRKGNLLLVATCSYFTPLFSTFVSCAYLNVSPSPRLWIGCLLLVLGSLLSWKSVSKP